MRYVYLIHLLQFEAKVDSVESGEMAETINNAFDTCICDFVTPSNEE